MRMRMMKRMRMRMMRMRMPEDHAGWMKIAMMVMMVMKRMTIDDVDH